MMSELSRKDAIRIIQHLRSGTPPPARLIRYIHVGRERWLQEMRWYLDNARDADLSAVRFVDGEYGSGKTHFLRMTAHDALERRFVVSEVTLRPDVNLHQFNTIWREMMQSLATPESNGEPEGIASILNRWCSEVETYPASLQKKLIDLDKATDLDPDFRVAIRGYLNAYATEANLDVYLQWLKGDTVHPPHVRATISRENARAMLRSFIHFLKIAGYSGLVIFLDELELLISQRPPVRNASYDTLRQFIDDADNLENFLLICSATPQMYQDNSRGFPSYPALAQRIGSMLTNTSGNYRAIRVNLSGEEAVLTREDLINLAKRIVEIHAVAENWDPNQIISEELIQGLVDDCIARGVEVPLPRLVAQMTVNLLERLQQNPKEQVDIVRQIEETRTTVIRQDRQRFRPWED